MESSPIRLTFLGTGTSMGVPVIGCSCKVCQSIDPHDKRYRCSVLVETQGKTIVIDTGPDFRSQMLRAGVTDLQAVLFTHEHKDHIAGLDDVRAFNFIRKASVDVFASEQVQVALKRDYHYVFAEHKYPGVPEISLHTIAKEPFEVHGIEVQPIEVMHHRMPVLGFRIGDLAYITDANYISEEEKEKLKGCEVLVLNALRKESHISHYTLEEAVELMDELQPKRGYLTHISHQMGLHADVEQELPPHIRIAYDELVVEI